MPIARPPLPLADYQRIFRVLKTVFDESQAGHEHASIFFSAAGAHLVEQVYKKRCQPVAGAAYYKLGDNTGSLLSFVDKDEKRDTPDADRGFHCWALCEGYVIDFMAPLFRESLQAKGIAGNCPRKMFQKPRETMVDSPLLMRKPGDFYMLPNVELTRKTLEEFFARNDAEVLLNICMHWYRKPPRDIARHLSIERNDGSVTQMTLSGLPLVGAW